MVMKNKKNKVAVGLAAITLALAGFGAAKAHEEYRGGNWDYMGGPHMGFGSMHNQRFMPGYQMHEDMDKIFESGNFKDLETLRDKYRMPLMPLISNEDDFNKAKKYFKVNEDRIRENPVFYRTGCPVW